MAAAKPQPVFSTQPSARRGAVPVLILDDERVDRYRLARLCSGLAFPCAVSQATSLAEFATALDETTFGLILVDFMLTDGTGLDALALLRVSARNHNAPTLMVSGVGQGGIDAQARAAGCTDFMSKDDLTPDQFSAAVKKALIVPDTALRPDRPSYSAAEVEQLMTLCTAKTVQGIKPLVSRLLRRMRDNRASGHATTESNLAGIEEGCMNLWLSLVEMEREDGAARLADLTQAHPIAAMTVEKMKPSKPPSPFTRLHQ